MNVDTGEFNAICSQVADHDAGLGEMEWRVGDAEAQMAQLSDLLTRLLRLVAPVVRHAADVKHQQRPRGRHRGDNWRQRRDRMQPWCHNGQ